MNTSFGDFTIHSRRLPGFIGIGVQKGGTTTLDRILRHHPAVLMPQRKELQFFSHHYGQGLSWYARQWPADETDPRLRGEITPYYIFHPYAPQRLQALLPTIRLVILLRDPVERTLSHYFHSCRLGLETLDLEQALEAEAQRLEGAHATLADPERRHRGHQEHSYLSRSRYEQQLPIWRACFPADQILTLRSEDLFQRPEAVWARLQTFLNLPAAPFPAHAFGRIHAGRGEAGGVPAALRDRLRDGLEPTYAFLASLPPLPSG